MLACLGKNGKTEERQARRGAPLSILCNEGNAKGRKAAKRFLGSKSGK